MSTNDKIVDWLNAQQFSTLNTTQNLLSGNTLHQVFKKNLDTYDNQMTVPFNTNKIINWNNLTNFLAKINITLSTDDKSHILQGNLQTVESILLQVNNHFQPKNKKQGSNLSYSEPLDLNKIDVKADPKQTKSLLQLFVLIMIKNLHINIKESVALLANESKYLAHVLAKGFKDQVVPVLNLLKDFQTYLPQVQQFCINKQNQVFFMKALKPGLISRFRQVGQISLQILVQFSAQTQYPFETMKNHLISTMILQYRRHPGLISQICSTIVKLSKFAKNLLTVLISDMSQKEFLAFSFEILCIAEESNQLKQFYSLLKFDELLALTLESLMDINNFQIALLILIKFIETNPKIVFQDQKKLSKIVTNIQKLNPSKKQQSIALINGFFTLFEIFYRENVLVTQILYKMIIFKYKHTFNQDESVIYSHNFSSIIKDFPAFSSLMMAMIADVIVEKIEHFKESIFEIDLNLLLQVVKRLCRKQRQPKTQRSSQISNKKSSKNLNNQNHIEIKGLDEEEALKIINTISEMFFEDINNSVILIKIMVLIVGAFENSPVIIQSAIRIVKISLAIYFANIRKLSICNKSTKGTIKLDDSNVLTKRKNIDIEFFLRKLINEKNQVINSNIQALLCYSYVQANAKCSTEALGLANVISLLGNLNQLLKKYEEDLKLMEKSKKSRKNSPPPEQDKNVAPSPELYNKKIIAPGQSYSDYINKVSKLSNHVLKGIEKSQKGFDQKKKKILDEEQKKLQEQHKMEQIQKKFTNKVLEKGVKVDPRSETLSRYLYEFDTKEAQIKKQAIYELRSLHIFNPAEEQSNDLEGLKYILKKYNKILRVFYSNYGGKLKTSPTGVIEEQTEKQNLLHLSNVWKIFKDYELDEFMTIKQAQYLVQKLNTVKRKGYNDTNLLDFQIFEDFIVQASLTMFTRPPKELLGYTIAGIVEETFYQFKMLAGENKIDIRLFDDELTLVEKDQSIAALNLQLKRNSDYILPEGYKKIIQKKVQYYHCVSANVFDQSYTDVIDVLDEFFYENFKFHIIEPFSEIVTNAYAKCLLSKKKQDSEELKEKYFSLNVKKQLFKYSGEDRKIARQVAFCLSEVVDCVQHGRKLGNKNKLTNKQMEEEKRKNDEELHKKRQKRDQQIKKMLQKQKQQKQAKRKQEEEERLKQSKKEEEEKAKKKQYEQNLKKKVEEYQQKKQMDKKKQGQDKKKQKLKSQQAYEKKRKQYLKVAQEIEKQQDLNKAIEKIDGLSKDDKNLLRQKSKALLRVKTNPLPLKDLKPATKLQPAKTEKKSAQKVSLAKQDPLSKKLGPIEKKKGNKSELTLNKTQSITDQMSK